MLAGLHLEHLGAHHSGIDWPPDGDQGDDGRSRDLAPGVAATAMARSTGGKARVTSDQAHDDSIHDTVEEPRKRAQQSAERDSRADYDQRDDKRVPRAIKEFGSAHRARARQCPASERRMAGCSRRATVRRGSGKPQSSTLTAVMTQKPITAIPARTGSVSQPGLTKD